MIDPLTGIAIGTSVAGTVYGMAQQGRAGELAKERAERKAKQLREQAGQERASGQIASNEQKRRAEILISNAQATVAASGGGTIDPSILRLITGLAEEGSRAGNVEKYQSETAAKGSENAADQALLEGEDSRQAGYTNAIGTFLGGAGSVASMFAKYNPDARKTRDTSGIDRY